MNVLVSVFNTQHKNINLLSIIIYDCSLNISNKRCGFLIHLISNFAGKQVLGGIYGGNISGVTAQHLEWVSLSLSLTLYV